MTDGFAVSQGATPSAVDDAKRRNVIWRINALVANDFAGYGGLTIEVCPVHCG